MEMLVVLVVLVLGGLLVAGWAGFGLFAYGQRARKRAEAKAPQTLDAAFDGRDSVVFKVNLESPSWETVIAGARERGYELVQDRRDTDVSHTLMFERVNSRSTPPAP